MNSSSTPKPSTTLFRVWNSSFFCCQTDITYVTHAKPRAQRAAVAATTVEMSTHLLVSVVMPPTIVQGKTILLLGVACVPRHYGGFHKHSLLAHGGFRGRVAHSFATLRKGGVFGPC